MMALSSLEMNHLLNSKEQKILMTGIGEHILEEDRREKPEYL